MSLTPPLIDWLLDLKMFDDGDFLQPQTSHFVFLTVSNIHILIISK